MFARVSPDSDDPCAAGADYGRAMALLSGMIRSATVTGQTDYINAWFGGRQGGRWAEQTVRAALPIDPPRHRRTPPAAAPPAARPPADPAEALRTLADLQQRGVVTAAEMERLRARLGI
jgi:hypothetical protein